MDDNHSSAREHFFAAIRILACSADSIQTRLIEANESILRVTIDEFDGDAEMKIKFARILDLLAADQDEIEIVALETAANMTDLEAGIAAHLICDLISAARLRWPLASWAHTSGTYRATLTF